MKRKKEHQQNFKKILGNERLAPNRAILGIAMSMYMDSEDDLERDMCYKIIMSFVEGSKFKWTDTAHGDQAEARANAVDAATGEDYLNFLDILKKDRESRQIKAAKTNAEENADVTG